MGIVVNKWGLLVKFLLANKMHQERDQWTEQCGTLTPCWNQKLLESLSSYVADNWLKRFAPGTVLTIKSEMASFWISCTVDFIEKPTFLLLQRLIFSYKFLHCPTNADILLVMYQKFLTHANIFLQTPSFAYILLQAPTNKLQHSLTIHLDISLNDLNVFVSNPDYMVTDVPDRNDEEVHVV